MNFKDFEPITIKKSHPKELQYLWMIPLTIGLIIAFMMPIDILSHDIPKFIVVLMSAIVPMIRKVQGNYELVEIAQFYYSIMWLTSPLFYISILKGGHLDEDKLVQGCRKHKLIMFVSVPLVTLGLAGFAFFIGPDPSVGDMKSFLALQNRFYLAVYGFVIPNGAAAMLALLTIWKQQFWKIYN